MLKIKGLSVDKLVIVGRMKTIQKSKKVGEGEVNELCSRVTQMLQGETDAYGARRTVLKNDEWLKIKASREYKSLAYNWRFSYGKHCFIQVNTLPTNYMGNNFRIEWNPNLVDEVEQIFINELLQNVLDKRYTRIDLALDIETDLSEWQVIDLTDREVEVEYKRRGKWESRYLGTNNSDVQVNIYNKQAERAKDGEQVEGVWWRIEERIRRSAAENWQEHDWFSGFKLMKGVTGIKEIDSIVWSEDMKAVEKAKIAGCIMMPSLLDEMNSHTRRKMEKRIKELARFEEIEEEFKPNEHIKKMTSEMVEVSKSLTKLIMLGEVYHKSSIKGKKYTSVLEEKREEKQGENQSKKREKVTAFELDREATKKYFS